MSNLNATNGSRPSDAGTSRNRFGWKPRAEVPPSSPPSTSRSTSLHTSSGEAHQTPVKNRTSTVQPPSTPPSHLKKRESGDTTITNIQTPNSRATQYQAKRDRGSNFQPNPSPTMGSRSVVNPRQTYGSPERSNRMSTTTSRPSHIPGSLGSPNTRPARPGFSPTQSRISTRPQVSPSPSRTPSRSSVRPQFTSTRQSQHANANANQGQGIADTLPSIPEIEEPLFSEEVQQQLAGEVLMELTARPEMEAFSSQFEVLDEIEQICKDNTKMTLKSPHPRDQVNELEVILQRIRDVFKEIIEKRNALIMAFDQIERSFLLYTACVNHNRVIKEKKHDEYKMKKQQIIEEVNELNSISLQLTETLNGIRDVVWNE